MNNIVTAKETLQIIKNKFYQIGEDKDMERFLMKSALQYMEKRMVPI